MKKKMVSWCLPSMLISILNLAFTFLVSIYLCIFLSTGLLVLTLMLRAKKMVQKMPTPQKEVQRKMFITQMLYFFILLIVVACITRYLSGKAISTWYRTHRIWHLPYSL